MKATIPFILGVLLSLGSFYYFFHYRVEIHVASGYNARLQGLFEWYHSYREYTILSDGTSLNIGSGQDIRSLPLIFEVIVCLVMGSTFSWIISAFLSSRTNSGEQAAPSNGGQRSSLNSDFHPRRG